MTGSNRQRASARVALWLGASLLLALAGCRDLAIEPAGSGAPPHGSAEAQQMALYLSGELTPPGPLAARIDTELSAIRATYGATYPMLDSLHFRLGYEPSAVIVGLAADAAQELRNGDYHAWDRLNRIYGLAGMDTTLLRIGAVILRFRPLLHPRRLAELYGPVDGVRYAEPNAWSGDPPNVYPRLTDAGTTYLFRNGWGDCPAGCTSYEYWYVAIEGGQPRFIGHWNPQQDPAPPPWWADASKNRDQYDQS